MATRPTLTALLKLLLILVFLDGAMELATSVSCIAWVHNGAAGPYTLSSPFGLGPFITPGRPQHLLFGQVWAASAAGGIALGVVASGGFLALWLRDPQTRFSHRRWATLWIQVWPYLCIASALFTLAVTIALNVQTDMHSGQTIDSGLAEALGPETEYPVGSWALPNFYSAVRGLVVDAGTARTIGGHLMLMRGWRWNLVVLVVLQSLLAGLAWVEGRQWAMRVRTEQAVVRMKDVEGAHSAAVLEKGLMS